jgi:hypothetical protein
MLVGVEFRLAIQSGRVSKYRVGYVIDKWDVSFSNEDRPVSFEGAGEMRESEVL